MRYPVCFKEIPVAFLACAALGIFASRVIRVAWDIPSAYGAVPALLLFMFLLSRMSGRNRDVVRGGRVTFVLGAAASALLMGYCYVVDAFGSFDIPAVLFHLSQGLEVEGDPKVVRYFFMYVLIWAAFTWAVSYVKSNDLRLRHTGRIALAACLLFNPLWLQAFDYVSTDESLRGRLAAQYQPPRLGDAMRVPRKNLVIIYLESMERTLGDPTFGDIYDDVEAMEADALSFTGLEQVEGVGWTTAGMVGSQCGVPLMPDGILGGNNLERAEEFLPGAECLGSVLAEKGYATTYVGGADLDFAGKGDFYREHGFQRVYGRDDLLQAHPGDVNGWGVPDDAVFEATLGEWRQLHAQGQPYFLAMLTTGAHAPDGFPTRACEREWGERYEKNIELGVKCSAWLARRLIARARRQGLLENTAVVVLSDHLMHKSSLSGRLEELPRRLLFMVFDDDLAPGKVDRAGSILDAYPTMLDVLGLVDERAPKAGLGVSLFSGKRNLIESFGTEGLDEMIRKDRPLRARLWGHDPSETADAEAAREGAGLTAASKR